MPEDDIQHLENQKPLSPDEPETITLPDPEEEEPEGAAAKPDDPTRAEKRRQRAQNHRALQDENETMRRELEQERAARYAAEQARIYQQPAQAQAPQTDPLEDAQKRIEQEMLDVQRDYGAMAPEQQKEVSERYRKKYIELQAKHHEVVAAKVVRSQQQYQQQNGVDPQFAAQQAALQQRYHDIVGHADPALRQRMISYMQGQFQARVASGGKPASFEDLDQVADETRRKFGIAKSPPPTPADRARFSGHPSSASPAARPNGSGARTFTLSPVDKKIARGYFPKDPENVAYQKYAQKFLVDEKK